MTLLFQYLTEELRPAAIAVAKYFQLNEGTKSIVAEAEIDPDVAYRPTLVGKSSDNSLLAIEVRNAAPTGVFDQFVTECITRGWAIRLFLAVRPGIPGAEWKAIHQLARRRGVGLLEATETKVAAELPALHLGLMGLRPIDPAAFPKAYRADLRRAEDTFRGGNPGKGCSEVYDVIEDYSRRVCRRIAQLGHWRVGYQPPAHNDSWYAKAPWATVIGEVADNVNFSSLQQSPVGIDRALWGSVVALPPDRNDTGHRPKTRRLLERRNAALRTRFENAVDVLAKLYKAARRSVRV